MITGSVVGCDETVTRCARSWRSFDLDAFLHDLSQSVRVLSPPSDPDELFTEYHRTLTSLFDQHALSADVARHRGARHHGMTTNVVSANEPFAVLSGPAIVPVQHSL